MRGLDWQTLQVPLGVGLSTGDDPFTMEPPGLSFAKDVRFDESGGIQTRWPYAALGTSIYPSGTLTDFRRLVTHGDELLCFTKDSLYSWNVGMSKWVLKATHLAVKVDEESMFVTTGDQILADRAELGGLAVYAWQDGSGVWLGAVDTATGQVVAGPTQLGTSTARFPKVVALSTRILVFFCPNVGSPGLSVIAIDPAAPIAGFASASTVVVAAAAFTAAGAYDVAKIPSADTAVVGARLAVGTSYQVSTVTAGLVVTSSTKARTCDGAIAVSCPPTGTHVQIARVNGTNVQGDYIQISGLTDVYTGQAIITGTAGSQVAAAHRSVQDSSQYRCYVFTGSSVTSSDTSTWYNYVDTGNNLGTAARLVRRLGPASRAFDHGGRVFVWLAFDGVSSFSGATPSAVRAQLQNTYFLYRDDATLHAKAAGGDAGGVPSFALLPSVTLVGGSTTAYEWAGVERRIIDLGDTTERARVPGFGAPAPRRVTGYSARAPRKVRLEFDSNAARRCASLGPTLYIAGGEILQYDGVGLYEVGFHVAPWYFGAVEVPTGNLADGTYAYKGTLEWLNAHGELDRSTTSTAGEVTIAGGPNGVQIPSWIPVYYTHKTATPAAMKFWRTAVNPTDAAAFYVVTDQDPSVTTNPNRYLVNDLTASTGSSFNDELSDTSLTVREAAAENGDLLEYLAPPPASIIIASASRLFLAGISDDPHRVWYSKQRPDGEVASFHDALTIDVPRDGGSITGLGWLNETLIVFKQTAIYALPGDGYDNFGTGSNFGPARLLSDDVGALEHESIAVTPGGLVFRSEKGWYVLNRGWALDFIGHNIRAREQVAGDLTVRSVDVVEHEHQVRIVEGDVMFVWDYLANQWSEWSASNPLGSCIWRGNHLILETVAGATAEQVNATTGYTFGMDVETAWIKLNGIQGLGRVRWLMALGRYLSGHHLRVRIAYDYLTDGDDIGSAQFTDDLYWTPSPTDSEQPLQVRIGPSRQRVEAIKIRLTAVDAVNHANPPSGPALRLSGLAFEVGIKRGLFRGLPAAQKD